MTDEQHDWRAECSGLAYMIEVIAQRYAEAKHAPGGDSEFLAFAIAQSKRYIDGPLAERMFGPTTEGTP